MEDESCLLAWVLADLTVSRKRDMSHTVRVLWSGTVILGKETNEDEWERKGSGHWHL